MAQNGDLSIGYGTFPIGKSIITIQICFDSNKIQKISVCGSTKVSLHPLCLSAQKTILELINIAFPVTDDEKDGIESAVLLILNLDA